MITIFLTILISINLIFLTYGRLRVYYILILSYKKNNYKITNKTKQASIVKIGDDDQIQKDYLDESKKGFSQLAKRFFRYLFKWTLVIIVVVLFLAVLLIIFGIITSKIWVTILLAINTNFVYAAIFLIGIETVFFFMGYGTHKALSIDSSVTKRALIMDTMQFSMLSILLYFAAFGYPLNVLDIVQVPFQWDIVFNNLASILLPMIFFSIIIINLLSVTIRVNNMLTKDREKHKLIRLHQLLFIFIASCFIGILYITDIDLSFMNDLERSMYLQTLEVVKWIVTSVFIPLFLYTLSNLKSKKSEKVVDYRRKHLHLKKGRNRFK